MQIKTYVQKFVQYKTIRLYVLYVLCSALQVGMGPGAKHAVDERDSGIRPVFTVNTGLHPRRYKSNRFAPIGMRLALRYSHFLRSTSSGIGAPNLALDEPHPDKTKPDLCGLCQNRLCLNLAACGTSRTRLRGQIPKVEDHKKLE